VAEHKILQKSYNDYLGVEEAGKELILYAVGDDALAPLKKLYISFGDTTVLRMIDHLCLKMAIKMTTAYSTSTGQRDTTPRGIRLPASPRTSLNLTASRCHWVTAESLQMYFIDKWLEHKQYSTTMAKQLRFKEAALLAQETAAAEEEGESQAMLFAMLQEQHNKQIAAMAATNKANMDVMMERMNAMVAGR